MKKKKKKKTQWIPKRCQTVKAEHGFIDNFAVLTLSYASGDLPTISPPQQYVLSLQKSPNLEDSSF